MASLEYARKHALENPESTATVIHAILLQRYGEEVYDWDPATVYLEVQADFQADMCTEAMDKWAAIQVIMGSNAVFQRLDAFLAVANTLSDGAPFFSSFNPVTTEEAAWALAEIAMNRELLPFSRAIKQYLRLTLKQDGFTDTDYPAVFAEVFDATPDASAVRKSLAALGNEENIDRFITDQMRDMVSQFNQIPDLSGVDNIILQRGLEESLPRGGSNG